MKSFEASDDSQKRLKQKQIRFRIIVILAFAIGAALGIYSGIRERAVPFEKQLIKEEMGKRA